MVEEEPLQGYASAKLPSFIFIFTLIRGVYILDHSTLLSE